MTLSSAVSDLDNKYEAAPSLLLSKLLDTVNKTNKILSESKSEEFRELYFSGRFIRNGGGISHWFFKRRAGRIYESILSACYHYRILEKDPTNLIIVDDVIHDVTEDVNKLKGEGKKARDARIAALIQIIPIIIGFVGLTIFTALYKYIEEQMKNLPFPEEPFMVFIVIVYIIMGVLELPLIRIHLQYRWYKKVMLILDIKKTEENVFKSLYPLELEIIDKSFPKRD